MADTRRVKCLKVHVIVNITTALVRQVRRQVGCVVSGTSGSAFIQVSMSELASLMRQRNAMRFFYYNHIFFVVISFDDFFMAKQQRQLFS